MTATAVRRALQAVLCAGLVTAGAAPVSAQCAMCRSLLATPEGQQMVAAFRGGILVLIAAPFSLFGIIAALAVRAQRRRVGRLAGAKPT